MTGADSPVMADSSTLAMPSMISPSPGITSPADTTHSSPIWSCGLGTSTIPPSRRTRAVVSACALRSESAWALPRPSATASAKLAKSTVNHSQRGDQSGEEVLVARGALQITQPDEGGEDAADRDHDHHRVASHDARVELHDGCP